MESEEKSVTWDDCQNEHCLKFIAKCRFGSLKRKQMKEEARRQKALKRELEVNEEYQRLLKASRAERLREQKEAFLAGGLVRDAFSDEERKQYSSLCHRK